VDNGIGHICSPDSPSADSRGRGPAIETCLAVRTGGLKTRERAFLPHHPAPARRSGWKSMPLPQGPAVPAGSRLARSTAAAGAILTAAGGGAKQER
jgi:hypothetical protein